MENKICVITGANAGLGYASSLALAKKKASLFLICRSEEKGKKAQANLVKNSKNEKIHLVLADLSSQADLQRAAQTIQAQTSRVDVLLNNAAMVASQRQTNEAGIEKLFAVNHLAYFYLTHLLMPQLQQSKDARVINIGSGNHFRGKMHFDDLFLEKQYHPLKAYNQTKLANLLFTYELDRQLQAKGWEHINTNCADPGLNNTRIGEKNTNWLHKLIWSLRRRQGQDPHEGAKCQIYLASSSEVRGISGKYWFQSKAVASSDASYKQEDAKRLWEISMSLCGIEDYFEKVDVVEGSAGD